MLIPPQKRFTGFNKSEFLTIPDAPNYEINGYFKVRNKKTGRILSNKKRVDRPTVVTTLWLDGKQVKRDVRAFYHQAVMAAIMPDGWYPVPSLQNLYEVNSAGKLRNTATKKILKPKLDGGCLYYVVSINYKSINKMVGALLAEVFDVPFKRKTKPVPVMLSKDGQAYYFKSITAGAKFLQGKVFFCADLIRKTMNRRCAEVYGWQVKYLG